MLSLAWEVYMDAAWKFDPFDPGFDRDPHPMLRILREQHPVYYWDIGRAWLVSRYDDCVTVLRDARFSVDRSHWKHAASLPTSSTDALYQEGLFGLAPEAHLRVRRLASPSFTPRAIERRRPEILALVEALLEDVGESPTFDLVQQFAGLLPVRAISGILGVARAHEDAFRSYSQAVIRGVNPMLRAAQGPELGAVLAAGRALLLDEIEDRRRAPREDLLSDLVRAEEAGDRLSSAELVALVTSLVIAGSETTTHLIGFGVLDLLGQPELLAELRARPERMPLAIDELLRFDLFSKLGVPRYTLEPVEIADTKLERGEMVLPMLAAALRDPRRFPDPDRFDIDRDQRHNIAFGHGPHYCLGAPLARLEGELALTELFRRYPALRLEREPSFEPHPMMRSLSSVVLATGG